MGPSFWPRPGLGVPPNLPGPKKPWRVFFRFWAGPFLVYIYIYKAVKGFCLWFPCMKRPIPGFLHLFQYFGCFIPRIFCSNFQNKNNPLKALSDVDEGETVGRKWCSLRTNQQRSQELYPSVWGLHWPKFHIEGKKPTWKTRRLTRNCQSPLEHSAHSNSDACLQ